MYTHMHQHYTQKECSGAEWYSAGWADVELDVLNSSLNSCMFLKTSPNTHLLELPSVPSVHLNKFWGALWEPVWPHFVNIV